MHQKIAATTFLIFILTAIFYVHSFVSFLPPVWPARRSSGPSDGYNSVRVD
jgi:hypothetical protein